MSKYILWLPVQLALLLSVHTTYTIGGKALAFIMVPLGIKLGWDTTVFGKKIFWPWDNIPNPRTGSYYDPWYGMENDPSQSKITWYFWNKGGFWREYYWRVRNGFSNGMRFGLPFKDQDDQSLLWMWTYDSTYFTKACYWQVDVSRPWLARMRIERDGGFFWYWGWKLGRGEGFGITHRGQPAILWYILCIIGLIWIF